MAESIYPKDFFRQAPVPRQPVCFVLMPFRDELAPVYSAIRDACKQVNLECKRADEIFKPGPILTQVMEGIAGASVIIGDLTGTNPNVFYELGLAHVVRRNVILLAQDLEQVPFDLRHLRLIKYSATSLSALKSNLVRTISDLEEEPVDAVGTTVSPQRDHLAVRNLLDLGSDQFGRNDHSTRLAMRRYECVSTQDDPASSFVIFSAVPQEPVSLRIDPSELRNWLNPNARRYEPDTRDLFVPIEPARPRLDGAICTERAAFTQSDLWSRYLLVQFDGYLEYGSTLAQCHRTETYFLLTPMIHAFWQFIHFSQDFYSFGGSGARFQAYISMVNTPNSQLAQLARGWREPTHPEFGECSERRTDQDHIQLVTEPIRPSTGADAVRAAVRDVAARTDHAYGVWEVRAFPNPAFADSEQVK